MLDSAIRVAVFRPGSLPWFGQIGNTLEDLQGVVGGYIEMVRIETGEGLVMVCNEDYIGLNLPKNRILWLTSEDVIPAGSRLDMIQGTFFVCRTEGEEFASINDGDEKRLAKWATTLDVWNYSAGACVNWDTP